jgi:hypothetical protein
MTKIAALARTPMPQVTYPPHRRGVPIKSISRKQTRIDGSENRVGALKTCLVLQKGEGWPPCRLLMPGAFVPTRWHPEIISVGGQHDAHHMLQNQLRSGLDL